MKRREPARIYIAYTCDLGSLVVLLRANGYPNVTLLLRRSAKMERLFFFVNNN